MQRLTLEDLDAEADRYDALVARTAGVDRFCTSSHWVLPAATRLVDEQDDVRADSFVHRDQRGYLVFQSRTLADGLRCLLPLEAVWGLACPIVGRSPGELARQLSDICDEHAGEFDLVVLAGMLSGSTLLREVSETLLPKHRVVQRTPTRRWVVELAGGFEAFLARRGPRFRRNLRRAWRMAEQCGLEYECAHFLPVEQAWARVLDIERRSWKGPAGVGIDGGAAEGFYRDIVRRLDRHAGRRLWFLRDEERDVAYVLGGTCGRVYRGLQMSFDASDADLSPGNLVQAHQIRELCAESGFTSYDLGTTAARYKQHWADNTVDSATVVVEL